MVRSGRVCSGPRRVRRREIGSRRGGGPAGFPPGGSVAARRDARQRRRPDLSAASRFVARQRARVARGGGAPADGHEGRDLRGAVGHRPHRSGSDDPHGPARGRQRHQGQLPHAARQWRGVRAGPHERVERRPCHHGARQSGDVARGLPDGEAERAGRPERPTADHRQLRPSPADPTQRRSRAEGDPEHVSGARDQHRGHAGARARDLLPARLRRLGLGADGEGAVGDTSGSASGAGRGRPTAGLERHRRPARG